MNRKDEVIAALCSIGTEVATKVYNNEQASDCFCGENSFTGKLPTLQYSEEVLDFIRDAVREKIQRMKS